jgi:hypothetical protein
MGIETILGAAAAPVVSSVVGGLLGSKGSSQSGTATQTTQQQLDPALRSLLYGSDGQGGLLQQIAAQAQQGQSGGLQSFGSGINDYLGGWGVNNFMRSQQNAQRLQETQNAAPQASYLPGISASTSNAAQIAAPSQNQLDLSGSYNRFINGDAGANPYLTQGLKAAEDASTAGFQQRQNAVTDTLQRSILPGIRSNAVLAGQYGGSRQGIAEGNALSDYTRQLTDANTSLSTANGAAGINAQAGAFNAGQDRALSATQGLGGQQYGTASQNAGFQQQTNLANQSAQQAASTNNSQMAQQTNLANLQAQLGTTAQNDARNIAGVGLSSGLLGQAVGYGTGAQNADWQKLLQGSGALGQFAGAGGSTTSSTPLYQNQGAGLLGGALSGLGIYNQFKNLGTPSTQSYVNNDWFTS